MKSFEILQKKAEAGYKDVDSFIKTKIINGEQVTIIILIGKGGIIDSDIRHQLEETIAFYKINFVRINLTSEKQIVEAIQHFENQCDIIAISRGGGESLEIFDSPEMAEASIDLSAYFITALGHKDNVPLLQKVADKSFITPTALGQYFNEIYNETVAGLKNSKAKLVNDITAQLNANYSKQISNLNEPVASLRVANERELKIVNQQQESIKEERLAYNNQIQVLQDKLKNSGKINGYTILLKVAALIIGFLFARFFLK
ncbi:MAG: exodeoxyribonuclease VII large subunit [Ginsengibacter sp.]